MEILKISSKNLRETIQKTIDAIKLGQVVVCPTDTVYGLLCDATNKQAVKKLYQIKKRPKNKPIPVFVKDIKMAKRLAKIDKKQEEFLKKVWPGAVTAVLETKKKGDTISIKPPIIYKNTVGVRIPKEKIILDLVKKLNCPLAESSVNISGQPPAKNIKEIIKQFKQRKHKPDLILAVDNFKSSKPSIVIDLTQDFKILRS